MSKGQGDGGAAGPNWRDKLAMLDQRYGCDEDDCSESSNTCGSDSEEVSREDRPSPNEQNSHNDTDDAQSTGSVIKNPAQDLPDVFYDDDEDWETESEEDHDDESDEDDNQPKSSLLTYLYHRFGPSLRWENRCTCCEFLVDRREARRKVEREYFAQAGGSCLIKDPCVLLPYRMADLPGTENVDKPVLTVTTPEGEELYPHDLEEYPEPPEDSRAGGPLASPNSRRYAVPYEEEDGPDL
ncbi:hypothetical protein KVR01_012885 [Diaporthe batatas]|uniref:uncharacterized protein n=1 Tax=Diaporthe batatas TaxID=748121 RepID=UPI001D052366|nr:uncharacterized protein KVR01_012885 [Diaporthe batatas]KAG8157177.1 hypothetical protein KVR01_012885 [Diaporthe batatas]